MGRFHGSPAEDLTAEAMIHGWEAICKLWEASSVLDNCDLDGPAIDTADKTVQQHLRDAIMLFETALDKFSCKIVYDIVGHAYNPILHELDRSDPEVEAFRQQQQGSIGSLSGAVLSDFLCGAAVATVVRPGLEVTGIMRARPRVWVTLLSTGGIRTSQTGINPVPVQHQQQLRFAPFVSKAPVLGAKALLTNPVQARKLDASGASNDAVRIDYLNASADSADIVALHSEELSAPTVLISGHTVRQPVSLPAARPACGTSSGVLEYSMAQRGDQQQQHGAEERTGCAAMQGKNPVCVTAAPVADGVLPILSSPSPLPVASAATSFAGAGPKGPLQLLLALRAGRRTGAVAVHAPTTTTDSKEKTTCSVRTDLDPGAGDLDPVRSGLVSAVAGSGGQKTIKRGGGSSPAIKESASGRFRKGTGTADTGGPRCGAPGSHDDGSPGGDSQRRRVGSDDVDNNDDGGHDDVCYQQYDTSTHHSATQPRVATGTAVQQSQVPQRGFLQHAPMRAANAMVATVVSPPGACSAPPAATVPRQAAATCGRTSTGGGGQAGTVLSSSERPMSAWPDVRCNPAGPIPGPSLDRFDPTVTAAPAAIPSGAFSGGGIEALKEMPICITDSVSHVAKDINETSASAVSGDRTSTSRNSAAGAATTRCDDNGGNGGTFNPARSAAAAAAPCGVPSSAALAAAAAVRAAVAAAAAANSRAGISSSTALPLTTPRNSAVRAAPQPPPPPPHATVIVNSDARAGSDGGAVADVAAALTSFAPAAPGLPSSPESKAESGVEPGAAAAGTSGRPRMEPPPRRMPTPGGGTLAGGKIAADAIAPVVAAAATATTCSGSGTYRDGPGVHASAQPHQGSRQQSGTRIAQVARRGHSSAAGVEVEIGDEDLGTSRPTLASPLTGHIQKTTSRSSAAAQPPQLQHLCPRKQQSSHTLIASTTAAANTNAVSEPSRASCSSDCGTGHGERASQDLVELDAVAAVTTGAADGGGSDVALGQQRHVSRGRRRGIGPGLWQPLPPPASQRQQRHQGQYHDCQPRRLQQHQHQQQERHMGRTDRASQLNQVHQREHYERHPPSDAPGVIGKVPSAHPQSADSMTSASRPGGGCGRGGGGAAASAATLLVEESPEAASVLTARGVGGAGACGGDDAGEEDEEQVEGEEQGDVPGLGTGRRGGRGGGGWRGRWGLRRRGGGGSWRRRGAGGPAAGAGPTGGRPMPQ